MSSLGTRISFDLSISDNSRVTADPPATKHTSGDNALGVLYSEIGAVHFHIDATRYREMAHVFADFATALYALADETTERHDHDGNRAVTMNTIVAGVVGA